MSPRQSMDSSRALRSPPPKFRQSLERSAQSDDDAFEDVGLNDETKQPQPKKKGIFSRFGDNSQAGDHTGDAARPSSSHRGFHLPGRKRGQSGQGAELGTIDYPGNKGDDDGIVR